MKTQAHSQINATKPLVFMPVQGSLLQRKCACGNHTVAGGECAECAKKKSNLQRKLAIGASNDPLEREADRVADQVMAAPGHSTVSGAPLHIQRYTGQATEGSETAPASVDHVLASSGRPLDTPLRKDMESRFGHDFSHVRVHSGGAAEQSAREVNANAYTVGHNVVFGAGRFAPGTHEGRRLIAHELTHVVQQSGSEGIRLDQSDDKRGPSSTSPESSFPALLVTGTVPVGIMRAPDKCLDECEEQFDKCLKHSNFPPACIGARSECQRRCPPSAEPKEPEKPAPKQECKAPHPVNLHTVGHLIGSLSFGFVTIHTWKSSTNKLEDLKDCKMSEYITYSKIPNPPYGGEDGKPVPESGTSERINEHRSDTGKGKDKHRTPSEWMRKPPSEGSFTVTQTYDYQCSGCGDEWVPFAHYVITSKTYKAGAQWKHKITKIGSEEQAGDSEEIDEEIG